MKFVGIRDFRNNSSKIWEMLIDENEIIITSNGKPLAILSSVAENNLEERLTALRCARAMTAVTSLQTKSMDAGTDKITTQEINSEIEKVRRSR